MHEILPTLRSLLIDHLTTSESLITDMAPGSDVVRVSNTSRFRRGDEIFLMSLTTGKAEKARIFAIGDTDGDGVVDDDFALKLVGPTTPGWTMANSSFVQKAINWIPLKRIYIGDLQQIPDYPTITISPLSESNEWWAIGATEHEYRVAIRVYVQTQNFEESNLTLSKYASAVKEILIDHIHPIINEQAETFALTADFLFGGTVLTIADTSKFGANDVVFLRDSQPHPSDQENVIRTVLSPTQLEISTPAEFDYLVSRQAQIIRINRYIYNSRPSDTNFGYVPGSGGSLLRAAEITWFGKEVRCRAGNLAT